MIELGPPTLYLDIDGVAIANNPPFPTVQLNFLERYSPEVVDRLGNTGLKIVWLSTWGREATYLSDSIDSLREAIVLPAQINDTKITTKRNALLDDQVRLPSPFVWVDDMITQWTRRVVEQRLRVPKLLIQPQTETGLTDAELKRIEGFARRYIN